MAVLAKRNGNAHSTRRSQAMPTAFGFFPDLLGVSRALDAMLSSSSAVPDIPVPAFPAIDISEQDGNYVIEAAVPGFNKDEISIEVTSNQVTISGEHDEEKDDKRRQYSEIRRAAFTRTIALPRDVDPQSAKASFENGILRVTLQPTSPIGTTKVPIEAK
jgi:HSP20 family protein